MPAIKQQPPVPKRSLGSILRQYLVRSAFFWVPALVFLALAEDVWEHEALPGDVAILESLNAFASPSFDAFFMVVTSLGSAPVVITAVGIATATLYYLGRRRDALFLAFAAGGTAVINVLLKLLFGRERPDLWQTLVIENGYSFPSGHAMISFTLALTVIILTWPTRYRWWAVCLGIVYAVSVGLSRLYLGVHFPSDIIGGWCISILWILTLYHVLRRIRRPAVRQTNN